MSTDLNTTPDVAALQQQFQELRQQNMLQGLEMARMRVYTAHPHLRDLGLLEDFQGSAEQIEAYGIKLAAKFPPPAPTPAPLTQAPGGQVPPTQPAPPAPETSVVPRPSGQDILPQHSADVTRADDIREKMRMGMATRQEVLWLAQWAPRREAEVGEGLTGNTGGWVSAVKGLRGNR